MSNKKRNQEIERSKKQKRRLSVGIGVLIVLAICAGIAWFAISVYQRSWIMTFEGERIPTNEYRFMLAQSQQNEFWLEPGEMAESAMSNLLQTLTIIHHANNLGLGMTNEERDAALDQLQGNQIIPNRRWAEFQSVGFMVDRLFDHHVPELALNAADFQEEIAEYIETRRPFYNETEYMYIVHDDINVILEVLMAIDNDENADFGSLALIHCMEQSGDDEFAVDEPTLLPLSVFEQILEPFGLEQVMELQPGGISELIMFGESFLLVYMHSLVEAQDSEIQESFLENRAMQQRSEQFFEIFEGLMENVEFEFNQRALDAL